MHILSKTSLALALLISSSVAQAQSIFACEPEWAALSRVLLPNAKVISATHARQDPHHIEARPALIAHMRNADLAVCTGATLEAGWLPTLQQRSGNSRVQNGASGMFYASEFVKLINPVSGIVTPFDGDVHPLGNPHFHTDPHRILQVAKALSKRMQIIWPDQATQIEQRFLKFETRWQTRIQDWERRAVPLKGKGIVAQHATFAYLWNWLGVTQKFDLEPKPGMAPSPGHLQQALNYLRTEPSHAVVVASYQDQRPSRWLVDQLNGKISLISLPATVGEDVHETALEEWFDSVLTSLLNPAASSVKK